MSEAQGKFPRRAFINPLGWHKGAMCEQVMATEVRANSLQSEYLSKEEAEAMVREAVAEYEGLKEALRHYNSDAMRLGSTISPRHADAALAAFPSPEVKK